MRFNDYWYDWHMMVYDDVEKIGKASFWAYLPNSCWNEGGGFGDMVTPKMLFNPVILKLWCLEIFFTSLTIFLPVAPDKIVLRPIPD